MKKVISIAIVLTIMFIGIPMLWNHVSPWAAILVAAIGIASIVLGIENKLNRKQ